MMNEKLARLQILNQLSELYGRNFSSGAIEMMLEDLSVLTFQELQIAVRSYRTNPKNTQFPLPAALVALIKPVENESDIPRQIGNKIWDSIARFGYNNHDQAREHLGELGWTVVQQMGGWSSICQCASEDQRGIFVAQARDLTESVMRLSKSGKLNHKHELPKPFDSTDQKRIENLVVGIFK
jgi:hypothetical protein